MTVPQVKVSVLFRVESGDFHALKELEVGKVPLISCGDTDNGVMGYFDIPEANQYEHAVTVAYNGSWPIMSKFHPYRFGAKDDVAVLVPHEHMSTLAMLYVAALLNRMTWRYSYGRKCFKEKLQNVELPVPVIKRNGHSAIDEDKIASVATTSVEDVLTSIGKETIDWLQKFKVSP